MESIIISLLILVFLGILCSLYLYLRKPKKQEEPDLNFTIGEGGDYATYAAAEADLSVAFDSDITFRQISDINEIGLVHPIRHRSTLDYPSTGDGFDRGVVYSW